MTTLDARPPSKLRDYSFAWVMGGMLIVSLLGQHWAQLADFRFQQEALGEVFRWSEYWPNFLQSVLENWQSEWAQLLAQVILLKYTLFRGSSQSREGDERREGKLDDLRADMDLLLTQHGLGRPV